MDVLAVELRTPYVALLAEGVDRNTRVVKRVKNVRVALLAEGVDRNAMAGQLPAGAAPSPSSRRAWIEISAGSNRT